MSWFSRPAVSGYRIPADRVRGHPGALGFPGSRYVQGPMLPGHPALCRPAHLSGACWECSGVDFVHLTAYSRNRLVLDDEGDDIDIKGKPLAGLGRSEEYRPFQIGVISKTAAQCPID